MLRTLAIVTIALLAAGGLAEAKKAKPAPGAETTNAEELPDPTNAPKWVEKAVGNILDGAGPLDDDTPAKGKK